jgi:plastocyanin
MLERKNMQTRNSKPILVLLFLGLIVLSVVYFKFNSPITRTQADEISTPKVSTNSSLITVNVEGGNFTFSPTEIKVKKGDTVKIVFLNKEGFHDWVIDDFNVRTPQIAAGKTAEVEFVADKSGTFEYYCSVGEHRQMGMKGNLVVE